MSYPEAFNNILRDIKTMKIRGAGRIARAAVSALKIVSEYYTGSPEEYINYLKKAARLLVETRPTAVSLPNGLRYVLNRLFKEYNAGVNKLDELKELLDKYVNEFIEISHDALRKIGEYGSRRIENGDVVLTHCNSEAALSVIVTAYREGKDPRVFATETRPRYQGRITAEALSKEGIDVTLIVDSAVRYFINDIDKVIVGADAIAANGAVVNKIGTSQIALAAFESRTPFMVAAESYKFSPDTLFGRLVKIEERPWDEVAPKEWYSKLGIKIRNPAFDVTPPRYIDLIITEMGVVSPESFPLLIYGKYGEFYREIEPWE
jgi:ribose 1,5-bisphosphate isomerase